jgi:antitoxin YefM
METVSLAEVKAKLSSYIDAVHAERDRVTITRNGRPVAVLISVEELESIEETLDILSDPEELAALREGIAAADHGDTLPLESVVASLHKAAG